MTGAADTTARVREGLLADRAEAIDVVRGWISGMVYGAGWRLTDPEAAIQDVTARLVELARSGRIREDTDFKSFVLTIARHTFTDIFRRERLKESVEAGGGVSVHASSLGEDPESALAVKEQRDALRFIVQALPAECRRLWRWVYGQGLAAGAVAERLGISVANVRVRVHRCLKTAREIRERYFPASLVRERS